MKLSNLLQTTLRPKKRVGRGIGSGRGKTSTRGMKGQKARGKIPLGFIGGTLPLYKKLPYRRGIGNPKLQSETLVIDISKLKSLKNNSEVNLETLISANLVDPREAQKRGVKIVGRGKLEISLTVKLATSVSAKEVIESAGGTVING